MEAVYSKREKMVFFSLSYGYMENRVPNDSDKNKR